MAEWRERGYVPDSDDEDDGEDGRNFVGSGPGQSLHNTSALTERYELIDNLSLVQGKPHQTPLAVASQPLTQPANPSEWGLATGSEHSADTEDHDEFISVTVSAKELTTVEKLEAQLTKGLETCRDVLTRASNPLDEIDSPLSSLPSSPATASQQGDDVAADVFRQSQVSPPQPAHEDQVLPASALPGMVMGRSLRPRALMQLHPFTIEFAKHQKDWNARGMRPVRLPDAQADPHPRQEEETQGGRTFRSSQNEGSSLPPSSPAANTVMVEEDESQSPRHPSRLVARSPTPEDDLPDLADIFDAKNPKSLKAFAGAKRKYRDDLDQSKHPKRLKLLDTGSALDHVARAGSRDSTFDLPLSPTRSASVSSSLHLHEQAIGHHQVSTPRPLPTPILSSERQAVGKNVIEVPSSSEESEKEGFSSSLGSDAEESGGMFRKRIKGVLPASWIKLDARQQQRPPAPKQPLSPERSRVIAAKGVAKHVVSLTGPHAGLTGQTWLPEYASAEEESGDEDEELSVSSKWLSRGVDKGDLILEDDKVVVEDEVDAMLPVARRAFATRRRSSKKRQKRLDDSWIVDDYARQTSTAYRSSSSRYTLGDSTRSKRKRPSNPSKKKSRGYQLNVLDAPGLAHEEETELPRFLKVAARNQTACRRLQNPRQKFFQLSSKEDTADINQQLHDWTTKTRPQGYAQKSHAARLARQKPIHTPKRTTTQAGLAKQNSDAQIRKLKVSTEQTLGQLQTPFPYAGTDSIVQSLDHISDRPRLQRLGLFFAHVNRSGQGNFVDPVVSRAAQLEAPRVSSGPLKHYIRAPQASQQILPSKLNQSVYEAGPVSQREVSLKSARRRKRPPKMTSLVEADSNVENFQQQVDNAKSLHDWIVNIPPESIADDLRDLFSSITLLQCSGYITAGKFAHYLQRSINRRARVDQHPADANAEAPPTSIENYTQSICLCFRSLHDAGTFHGPEADVVENTKDWIFKWSSELQDLLSEASWFCHPPDLAALSQICADLHIIIFEVQRFVTEYGLAYNYIGSALLNKLMVCAYLLADIVGTIAKQDEDLARNSRILFQDTAKAAMKAALDVALSGTIPLKSPEVNQDQDWPLPFAAPLLPESLVDCVVVAYHLLDRERLPGTNQDFGSILRVICFETFSFLPVAKLAFGLSVLRIICPLTKLNKQGQHVEAEIGWVGWDFLQHFIESFLSYALGPVTSTEDQAGALFPNLGQPSISRNRNRFSRAKHAQVLRVLYQHCISFMRTWIWPDPDAIVQMIMSFYAKRDLVGLSPEPDMSRVLQSKDKKREFDFGATDFGSFLTFVATVVHRKCTSGEGPTPSSKVNSAQSLMFSLLPTSTNFFDTRQKVQETGLESLRNHFDLYLALYMSSSPSLRPHLRQIEALVDFARSYTAVRAIAINMWHDTAIYVASLDGACNDQTYVQEWGLRILNCTIWEMRMIPPADEGSRDFRGPEQRALSSRNMSEVFMAWRDALNVCEPSRSSASHPLLPTTLKSTLQELVKVTTVHFTHDTSLLSHKSAQEMFPWVWRIGAYVDLMELLAEVVVRSQHSGGSRDDAVEIATKTMSLLLSTEIDYAAPGGRLDADHSQLLERAVVAWNDIAASLVNVHTTWADYLSGYAPFSFDMLAGTNNCGQAKALFAALIVHRSPMMFTQDRYTFYAIWLERLVMPDHLLVFEHALSVEIHQYDSAPNLLGGALSNFMGSNGFSLETLKEHRGQILSQLVERLHALWKSPTDSAESQESAEDMLSPDQVIKLLEVMNHAMKAQWLHCQKVDYTDFIHSAIRQIQCYHFGEWSVDPWFLDGQCGFPGVVQRFADYFKLPVGATPATLAFEVVRAFRLSAFDAISSGDVTKWVLETADALACNSKAGGDTLTEDRQLLVDPALQVNFLRFVCPLFIERGFIDPDAVEVALAVVCLVNKCMHDARSRLKEANDQADFASMVISVLCRLARFLQGTDVVGALPVACADLAVVCYRRFCCLRLANEDQNLGALADNAAQVVIKRLRREESEALELVWASANDERVETLVKAELVVREWPRGPVVEQGLLGAEEVLRRWEEALGEEGWVGDDLFF